MKDKQKKKKERTWAEAARMVLENYSDAPMTPKQILHVIETKGLKEMSGTSPLACLNTLLHSQCRGDDGIFFKLPGRLSLFTLKKDALQWSKSMAVPEGEGLEDSADVESCDSNETSTASGESDMSLDETSSSASCSTETQSKQTPQARQSSLRAAQQGRAASACSERESGRQRKKGVMMPRVVLTPLKVNGEHVPSGFPGKCREAELSSTCSSSSAIACSSSLRSRAELSRKHGQRFKNLHKSQTGQKEKRNKGEEVDFETPGSILVNTNIRALINTRTLATLPPHLQQQLLLLLPEVDRPVGVDGLARLSSSALNNEFFTHASLCWKERLADGEFTHEMQVRIRQEMEKEKKVELWKEKFFEDYYGQRLGLTKEESLKQTLVQEDSGNLTATAIPTGPAKKRAAGRRRKDGRLRRRSRSDLRTRARRALCRQPKLEEAEDHSESAAAALGIEATSQGEHELQTELEEAGTEAQATHAISVAAVSLVGGQLETPAALCSADSSSSHDNQRDLGATSAFPDQRAYLSADANDKNDSREVKDQKRKFGEPSASTSFPEKKPRLDDRQSFRNTIDCVHPEKPHRTKEEPKVPPIRIQLSRIKPPWVVKGQPTYQICPRIIPNQETDSRGRAGARTLADVKARAQQARAQREAAAAVAAAGGGEGPERGGGPGGGGGRRDCYEPAEPGGSKGELTEALSNHLEGAQLQQEPVMGTEDEMVSETELLQNVKSEIIQTEISLEKECHIKVLPKVSHPLVGSARYADPAGVDRMSASQQIDEPNYTDDVIYTEEVEPVSEEDKPIQVIETQEQVLEMVSEPVGIEDHLETETRSEEIQCQYFEVKSDVVTVLVPTSIPDTLPRFGAEGIDALRTLVSLQPLEGVHSVYKEIKVKKYKTKEVESEEDEECISPRLPNHKEERNGHGTEISLQNCEQLNKTQSPEKTKPCAQLLHIKGVACISEDIPCVDAEKHASNQTVLVDLDLVSTCLHSEAGMHSDSTETASDFENENGHSWHAEIDNKKCSPDTASTIVPSSPVAAAKSNSWNPVSEACQASSDGDNIDEGRKKENTDGSQTEAHNPLSTVQKNAEAPRKAGSSSRHVSSVEANNPLVTQLLQGSLPLEKVLPQPNSTSKLEIHRLPVPLLKLQENQSVKSVQSNIGRGEDSCTTNSKTHQDVPPKAGQGHLKSSLAHNEVWVQSRVSSNEISSCGGQILGFQEQVNTVVTPNTHEDSRVTEQGMSSCCFEEVANIAGGPSQVNSPALSNNNPSNSAFGQNSAFGLIVDKGYPGVPGQKGAAQECRAGDVQCNTVMDQVPSQNRQVSPQNNFVSREVVPTVKIDWHPKQQPENPSCQSPSKNVLITGKKDSASSFESKEHFPGTLLNVGMSLVRLTRESGKPFQHPLEPSYIPFQLNIQQQFYRKLPKLHYNSSLGFNYTTNMPISDRALSGFSKNIANSVMQLQQKTFAEHSVEEMALKCSCRLRAMIVCQGCGAFCHDDCIGPSKLCVSCLVR
ncbi:polycomb group protein ASXL1-like isoform X2 [Polyodon spathula]|uniref:polycomb group protein ASXL1-like isoform X2 n=1 Tax=Polyodon spathula TaxID=7913 RepID=UPI001B7E564C|nr:polycomb group protein ASXL1-like isoform X2 [Polyodon spathula]